MKMPGQFTWPKLLSNNLGNYGKRLSGGHDMVRRTDRQGEVLIWCRKCSGYSRQKMGRQVDEQLEAGASGHRRARRNVDTYSGLWRTAGSLPRKQGIGRLKDRKKNDKKRKENAAGQRCVAQRGRRPCERVQGHAWR